MQNSSSSTLIREKVGEDLLVADPATGQCHLLDREAQEILRRHEASEPLPAAEPERSRQRVALTELHQAGLSTAPPEPLTRGEFMKRCGAAVALPLILTVALPKPASAASASGPVPTLTNPDPPDGPMAGGTYVSLDGTGLTGATLVSFGGVPSPSFNVFSDILIEAASPPYPFPGIIQITVTTPGGTSNGLPYEYR